MNDDFLYNVETKVLIQTFAEETSQIPLIAEGKTFYASLVWDYIYRYGLKAEFLANFLGVSEEGLLGAIGEFVAEVKAKIDANIEEDGVLAIAIARELVVQEVKEDTDYKT